MAANVITLGRITLVFCVLLLFKADFYLRLVAVSITILVFYLDSLDGYIARKLGVASDFGALFDIAGDRIVEHIYLIFYTPCLPLQSGRIWGIKGSRISAARSDIGL